MKFSDPIIEKYFRSFDSENIKPLSKQQEKELVLLWKNEKDIKARDKIIKHNLKFVVRCANKFANVCNGGTITIHDLIQSGNIGMLRALDKFDSERNVRFITYAMHWINAYMRYFVYNNVGPLKVVTNSTTRSMFEKRWTVFQAISDRDPDALNKFERKFKKKYKCSNDQIKAAEQRMQSLLTQRSLDGVVNADGVAGGHPQDSNTLYNYIPSDKFDPHYLVATKNDHNILKNKLRRMVKSLPVRDRDIIRLRYLKEDGCLTLQQVGNKYGISRERVRQLEERILEGMKEKLEKHQAIQEILQ